MGLQGGVVAMVAAAMAISQWLGGGFVVALWWPEAVCCAVHCVAELCGHPV